MKIKECDALRAVGFGPQTSGPGFTFYMGCLWPSAGFTREIKGFSKTWATRSHWFGDKPCTNYQLKGVAYSKKFDLHPYRWQRTTMSSTRLPTHSETVMFKSGNRYYCVLPYDAFEIVGQPCTFPYSYRVNGTANWWAFVIDKVDSEKIIYRLADSSVLSDVPDTVLEKLKTVPQRQMLWRQAVVINATDYDGPVLRPWGDVLKEEACKDISSIVSFPLPTFPAGELCMEAVQGTRAININTLMYCKELLEMGDLIRSTWDAAKALIGSKNPKKIAKAAADLYLSYHYGYRLSVADTVTLYEAARSEYRSWVRSQAASRSRLFSDATYVAPSSLAGLTAQVTDCCKVWYNQLDHGLESLLNYLFRWDVFPELGNVYDMIPFSFVVDWFLPFGDIIDKIDYHTYAYTLDVYSIVYSRKIEVSGLSLDVPFLQGLFKGYTTPGLTFTEYHRWMEPELAFPPLELKPQAGPKNWIPAGALILQGL